MNKIIKLVLVLMFLGFFAFSTIAREKPRDIQKTTDKPFFPTQADMLNYSSYLIEENDEQFDKISNRIIKAYANDKNFVKCFKKEVEAFKAFRLIQRDTVLPGEIDDGAFYGSNYGIHSNAYLMELTNDEIKHFKRMLKLYCLYNDFGKVPCSEKDIENIFKI